MGTDGLLHSRWRRRQGWRVGLLALLCLFSLTFVPAAHTQAQGANLLRNSNFETGRLNPWFKSPSANPGIVALESCCANQTPGGRWDAFIQPQGKYIELTQSVEVRPTPTAGAVTPGRRYFLSAEVSTNGMLARLEWFSDATTDTLCASTTVNWPRVVTLKCSFTLPARTTYFNVHLAGSAAPGLWAVCDDWLLIDITGLAVKL